MNPTLTLTGRHVRAVRQALGLDAESFAERVGIGPSVLRKIEDGGSRITRVVENAIRFIILTDGPDLGDACGDCQGRGTVRLPRADERAGFVIIRCPECRGLGAFGYDCRVIV